MSFFVAAISIYLEYLMISSGSSRIVQLQKINENFTLLSMKTPHFCADFIYYLYARILGKSVMVLWQILKLSTHRNLPVIYFINLFTTHAQSVSLIYLFIDLKHFHNSFSNYLSNIIVLHECSSNILKTTKFQELRDNRCFS